MYSTLKTYSTNLTLLIKQIDNTRGTWKAPLYYIYISNLWSVPRCSGTVLRGRAAFSWQLGTTWHACPLLPDPSFSLGSSHALFLPLPAQAEPPGTLEHHSAEEWRRGGWGGETERWRGKWVSKKILVLYWKNSINSFFVFVQFVLVKLKKADKNHIIIVIILSLENN